MSPGENWVALLLPENILSMKREELINKIKQIKSSMGEKLVILAHHYQTDDIVELADHRGDSLVLARLCSRLENAEYIVFCGVEFMVEAASILSRENQKVIFPAPHAGCPLADMASKAEVEKTWVELLKLIPDQKILPITYVNSSSELKAFCGDKGGIICTSANAANVIGWALERADKFLFMPDENLGRNSSGAQGISKEKILVWNPSLPHGGCDPEDLKNATAILWKGYCHVHTEFTLQHVKMARDNYPGCRVIVHPECTEDVANASDAMGSTSQIIKYVDQAPPESTIAIGTEINLVRRLDREHEDKTIVELAESDCPDMAQVTLRNLYWALENLGKVNIVDVGERINNSARIALERMLEIKG